MKNTLSKPNALDKVLLKFFADVMYLKGLVCFEEFEMMMEVSTAEDLDEVFERMMKEEYNQYARGENNWNYAR